MTSPHPYASMPAMATTSPAERARAITDLQAALAAGDAAALAQVSAALLVDAPAVVLALARGPASSRGSALAAWARALWQADQVEPLARVFAQLALGADLQQDAVQHFGAGPLAEDGSPSYAHAVALGYYVGVLQASLAAAAPREGERQALVTRLLRSAAAQASVAEPGPALPPPQASAGARWVRYSLFPLLATGDGHDAEDRLLAAALPVAAVGVLPNGEPDLEAAAGSGAQSAFLRRQQGSRRALER
ncbi:MAG: hypothetical protein Q4G71_08570 [Pseudomonadota bacterium]|nr:hypothetical protein [Pseudomonadota bacterium]